MYFFLFYQLLICFESGFSETKVNYLLFADPVDSLVSGSKIKEKFRFWSRKIKVLTYSAGILGEGMPSSRRK